MGIPSFYRWLVERYPRSVIQAAEESPTFINGVTVPIDTTRPNPNGVEYDNLYLDMNGIIHPCFHPEGLTAPKTNEEVFSAMFKYIDRVFSIIRPRKLLFLAIDGVAPRAKMNQQRTRRFRSAKEVADEVSAIERRQGVNEAEPTELADKKLDSNVITPGTEFMEVLSSALQYYIHLRMNTDPGWQGIKVILSDASVPGEGEHKIVSYIRMQRNLPGFDPNTHHCLYGLDADLIMLALATHEIHFTILREDIHFASEKDRSLNSGKNGSGQSKQGEGFGGVFDNFLSKQKFQLLRIWILRDYLAHELRIPDPTVNADLERLIDDFVFMCLFVGNDFLPHMPSLEIREGAIDLLMTVYKKEFVHMGGYLTNSFELPQVADTQDDLMSKFFLSVGPFINNISVANFLSCLNYKVNLERVGHFIRAVGSHETAIFRKRKQVEKKWDLRLRRSSAKSSLRGTKAITKDVDVSSAVDKVKLGEEGCKERYYAEKFKVQTDDDSNGIRKNAVAEYVKGMCWVMHYYYQGICSWQWGEDDALCVWDTTTYIMQNNSDSLLLEPVDTFPYAYAGMERNEGVLRFYPFHYAPFASDFECLDQLEINFTLGKPFKPFDQLMGVLPAASAQALPVFYRNLMTDPSSPILDFYPTEFEVDLNGKRHAWQGVCKLPFIEEARLLAEITKVEHTLTDEEKRRNSLGLDVFFVFESHPLAGEVLCFFERKKDNPKLLKGKVKRKINPEISGGMNGYIYISNKPVCPAEIHSPINDTETIRSNKVISVFYKLPAFHSHIPRLPEGVIMPRKIISKQDIRPPAIPWHEKTDIASRRFSERPLPPKSVSGPYLAKLARQLVSETYVAMSQARKNECGNENMESDGASGLSTGQMERLRIKGKNSNQNPEFWLIKRLNQNEYGEREGSDLTKVQPPKSQAVEDQNGNGKKDGSAISKWKRRKLRIKEKIRLKKESKMNQDQSGNGESDGSGLTKVHLVSETYAAKSGASENQNQNGEREGSVLTKVQLASETHVAKPGASENPNRIGEREGSGLPKVQLAKSQAGEDQNGNGEGVISGLSKRQRKRLRIKERNMNQAQSGNGEREGSGLTNVPLVSETSVAKSGASENQNGKREGSDLTKNQKKKQRVADWITKKLNQLPSSVGGTQVTGAPEEE